MKKLMLAASLALCGLVGVAWYVRGEVRAAEARGVLAVGMSREQVAKIAGAPAATVFSQVALWSYEEQIYAKPLQKVALLWGHVFSIASVTPQALRTARENGAALPAMLPVAGGTPVPIAATPTPMDRDWMFKHMPLDKRRKKH